MDHEAEPAPTHLATCRFRILKAILRTRSDWNVVRKAENQFLLRLSIHTYLAVFGRKGRCHGRRSLLMTDLRLYRCENSLCLILHSDECERPARPFVERRPQLRLPCVSWNKSCVHLMGFKSCAYPAALARIERATVMAGTRY